MRKWRVEGPWNCGPCGNWGGIKSVMSPGRRRWAQGEGDGVAFLQGKLRIPREDAGERKAWIGRPCSRGVDGITFRGGRTGRFIERQNAVHKKGVAKKLGTREKIRVIGKGHWVDLRGRIPCGSGPRGERFLH